MGEAIIEIPGALDWLYARYFAPKSAKSTNKNPPRQRAGAALLGNDGALIDKIRASKQGPEFDRLWSGDAGEDASGADFRLCNILAFWTGNDAEQIDRLFRQSGLFQNEGRAAKWDRKHHADGRTYGQGTIDKAIAGTHETYRGGFQTPAGNKGPANAIKRLPPAPDVDGWPEPLGDERPVTPCGDVANAQRIHRYFGADLLYVPGIGWLTWRGDHWKPDDSGAMRCALQMGRLIAGEASTLASEAAALDPEGKRFLKESEGEPENPQTKKAKTLQTRSDNLRAWAATVEQQGPRIPRALTLAQAYLTKRADELDANPWLLPTVNGTLDLRTGTLHPHRRGDFCTSAITTPYDPQATAPTWKRFLNEVFAENQALIDYIQRAAGYCLTGDVREHVLFILYGTGSNGKSTFLNALQTVFGLLMRPAAPGLLMAAHGERHPADIADIRGARLVTAVENTEGKSFDEERVKWLTGGDRLKARMMRQNFFEFGPTAKFWLATNHKPVVRGGDYGIWRRIHLIPFTVTFPPEKKDSTLPAKLAAEAPGILAWLVEGCLAWQRDGLAPPDEVLAATEEYRSEMDTIGQFIGERLVEDIQATVTAKDVYCAYKGWCEENGLRPASQQALGRKLTERGLDRHRVTSGIVWQGVRLRAMNDMNNMNLFPDEPIETPTREASTGNHEKGSYHSSTQGAVLVRCVGCVHWRGVCSEGVRVEDADFLGTCRQFNPMAVKGDR
jgi:putative DNA primase/helicase